MSDDHFRAIAILGLGLLGGSLGLALRALPDAPEVIGWDRRREIAEVALERGAISRSASTVAACVAAADLVVLAVPVLAMEGLFVELAPHLRPGTVVTDVGSTKGMVCAWATAILPAHAHFIGGHPMAGGERPGIAAARGDLLRGALYCLTPLAMTPDVVTERVERLVRQIGSRPFRCAPGEHDHDVAAISHLPFVVAALLVDLARRDPRWPIAQQLAATGFRDTTRLASGDVTMHRDICLTNTSELQAQLSAAAARLQQLTDLLDDPAALEEWFAAAKYTRDTWIAAMDVDRSSP